jgi:hypothetical protein
MLPLLLALLGSVAAAQNQDGADTGLEGVITLAPARPGPTRENAPSVGFGNATFAVEDKNGAVRSFTTDHEGRFRISLNPGHYTVSLQNRKRGIGRFGPWETDVIVGKMTKVEWRCDTGIR